MTAEPWEEFCWNGEPLRGLCGHCGVMVDSTSRNHRVTSIVRGGRGVECVLRGELRPADAGPLRPYRDSRPWESRPTEERT